MSDIDAQTYDEYEDYWDRDDQDDRCEWCGGAFDVIPESYCDRCDFGPLCTKCCRTWDDVVGHICQLCEEAIRKGGSLFHPHEEDLAPPHDFQAAGWRFWICSHCYAPRRLHPRTDWVIARAEGDTQFISAQAPHFEEGW